MYCVDADGWEEFLEEGLPYECERRALNSLLVHTGEGSIIVTGDRFRRSPDAWFDEL